MSYLLVILIFWTDPTFGPTESRYEVRVMGHYSARDVCEKRRQKLMDGRPVDAGRMLWSECRAAD